MQKRDKSSKALRSCHVCGIDIEHRHKSAKCCSAACREVSVRSWQKTNPDKMRENARSYYYNNRSVILEKYRRQRAESRGEAVRLCVVCQADITRRHGGAKVCSDACKRTRMAEYKRAYSKALYLSDDERLLRKRERSRVNYMKNRDRVIERTMQRYRKEDPEVRREKRRKYYAGNAEKICERRRLSYQENLEAERAKARARRAERQAAFEIFREMKLV